MSPPFTSLQTIIFPEEEGEGVKYTRKVFQDYVKTEPPASPSASPSPSPWTFLHVLSLIESNWAYDSLCGIDPLIGVVPQKEGGSLLSDLLRLKKAFHAPSYRERFNQLESLANELGEKNDVTIEAFSSDWKLVQKELASCQAKSKIKETRNQRRIFGFVLCLIRGAVVTADEARSLYAAAFRLSKSDEKMNHCILSTWPSFQVPHFSRFVLDLKGAVKCDALACPTLAVQCLRSQLHIDVCHGGLWKSTKDNPLLNLEEWVTKEKLTFVCPLRSEDVTECCERGGLTTSLAWSGLLSECTASCHSFDVKLAHKFSSLATVVLEGCKVRGRAISAISSICSIQSLANAVCLPQGFVDLDHKQVLSKLERLLMPSFSFGVAEMCLLHFHNLFFSLPKPPTPVFKGDSVLAHAWRMLNALLGGTPNELSDPCKWMRERFQREAHRRNKKLADCLNPSEPVSIPVFSEKELKEDGWVTAEEDDDLFD